MLFTDNRADAGDGRGPSFASPTYNGCVKRLQNADAWSAMGDELRSRGDLSSALQCYESALDAGGDVGFANVRLADVCLLLGDFSRGWRHYEHRYDGALSDKTSLLNYPLPIWQGDSLNDKTILIQGEQGCGQQITFASVLPDVIKEADHVIVTCHRDVERLFQRSFPHATVICESARVPNLAFAAARDQVIDCKILMGSLPRYKRASIAEFSRQTRYLYPDAKKSLYWRGRLDELGAGCAVGLRWCDGDLSSQVSRLSSELEYWLPMLAQDNAHFVSLQPGGSAEARRFTARTGIAVHDWPEAVVDLDSAAALVNELDVIVSVCSPVADLAGAMGKDTWIMTPQVPDWRYGLHGNSTPWYPSARIFRQSTAGGWSGVIDQISHELAQFIEARD